jgi:cystathionine gamma-synthase
VTIANTSPPSPLVPLPDGTDAVHAGVPSARSDHGVVPAVVQTATYTFADTADLERFQDGRDPELERQEYGRYGNPTVREVERRIAALDGAEDALLFASGMAAVTTALFALVKAGDHIILFRDTYRRTRQFVVSILGRFGVEHSLIEPTSLADLKAAIRPRTRAAITESPTNPYLRCIDLSAFAAVCREARVKSIVDATFATPCNARPLSHGVDLVIHSATKYLGGHNDVLGGSASGSTPLISLIRDTRSVLGGVTDPHAAALIGRGMKTLALRVERQNATALAVARLLEAHPAVAKVHYPWLSSHPDHAVAKAQMRGGGGVVSFEVRGGRAAATRVVDRCRLAIIAPSLGGVETLIEQPAVMSFHDLGDEELAAVGIVPGLIRLAVGIEETEAVAGDLKKALDAEAP